MRDRIAVLLALAVAALGPSCRSDRPAGHEHEHEETAAPHAEAAGDRIVVPLEGIRGLRILPAPEPREEGAWFPGEAIGDERGRVAISSPVAGVVVSPPLAPGRPVRAGAELVVLASPEKAEWIARSSAARAELERAEAALAREERLLEAGATSAREVEDARRDARSARGAAQAATLGLEARGLASSESTSRVVLRAPAGGSVLGWNVLLGQGVEAGQALATFQSDAARLVRVELPLPGPAWKLGDETEVRASDGRRWTAVVVGIPAALSPDTRRMEFRLELRGASLPIPGNPVEARVPFEIGVILPQSALQQIEGAWGVFVKSGDTAEFRPVRRGLELGSDVTVIAGVAPGEEVVTDGAYLLKSVWLKAKSGGAEHEH